MQPLVSPVDHEARSDARGGSSDGGSERAPLLRRGYAAGAAPPERWRRALAALALAAMLLVLLGGVVIGIYLLVVQQRSEPEVVVERVLARGAWDVRATRVLLSAPADAPPPARRVLAPHTASEECDAPDACRGLLRRLQEERGELPYNAAVSSDGAAYVVLGWAAQSPLVPAAERPALVVAFIGNFTERAPSPLQTEAARRLCAEAVRLGHLTPSFTLLPPGGPSRLDGAPRSLAPPAEPRS